MRMMRPVSRFFICLNIFLAVSFQADSGLLRGEIQVMSANWVSGGWPNINYYSNSRCISQGLTPDIVIIQEFKVATGSTREEYVNEVFGPGYYLYYEIRSSPNRIISLWAVRGISRTYLGSASDLPVPGDYAGTGTDAVGIFRGTSGLWAVRGITRAYYGSSGYVPVTR